MDDLTRKALHLLCADPHYLHDAKAGSRTGNTILGCVLSITTKSPLADCKHNRREAERMIAEYFR